MLQLKTNERLVDIIKDRSLNFWELDNEYVDLIFKTIAFFHIFITRTINYFRYTKSQKDSLVNAVKDGLKM